MASKKKAAAPVVGCDCAEKIDEMLKPRGGALVGTLRLNTAPRRVYVAVEKRDTASRVKPPMLAVSYCPFCGVKAP